MLKFRKAKNSKRGLYLQDKEIQESMFQVGSNFKYIIDQKNKQMVIVPTETSKNKVSKRTTKNGVTPVIDIRNKKDLSVFSNAEYLQVEILEDKIIVTGFEKEEEQITVCSNLITKTKKLFIKNKKKVDITSLLASKKRFEIHLSKNDLKKAVGSNHFEQLSIFSDIEVNETYSRKSIQDVNHALHGIEIPLQVISLFSGAGVMDTGFIQEGFDISFALELNEEAVSTYKANHSSPIETIDITKFDKTRFSYIGSPIMIGGSPCQGFSQANRQTNFLDNPNNLLVKEFIDSVKSNPNCQIFVLENVPKLLTAGDGKFKDEICSELSDFEITTGVLNALDYGEAQDRKRAFIIGSKIGKVDLPRPTHSEDAYLTVRESFEGLHKDVPNQMDYSTPRPSTVERMKTVPQGGNWKDFPEHFKTKSMFTGNTHSSIYRRLSWSTPSITIANPRKSNITHPSENRTLSVRECARLFGLKDDYIFKGSLSSMQQQICNAVPVKLAKAIASKIKETIVQFNNKDKYKPLYLVR